MPRRAAKSVIARMSASLSYRGGSRITLPNSIWLADSLAIFFSVNEVPAAYDQHCFVFPGRHQFPSSGSAD
jgi:hypothetical protein